MSLQSIQYTDTRTIPGLASVKYKSHANSPKHRGLLPQEGSLCFPGLLGLYAYPRTWTASSLAISPWYPERYPLI